MDMLTRLDRFVHVTRLDSFTSYGRRPSYTFRWLPLVAFALLGGGYALMVMGTGSDLSPRTVAIGGGLLVTGMMMSVILIGLGPRFRNMGVPVDERDREIESRAGDLGGRLFGFAVMLACFYFTVATMAGSWMPERPTDWSTLGIILMIAPWLLRIWIASWMQPRLEEED